MDFFRKQMINTHKETSTPIEKGRNRTKILSNKFANKMKQQRYKLCMIYSTVAANKILSLMGISYEQSCRRKNSNISRLEEKVVPIIYYDKHKP